MRIISKFRQTELNVTRKKILAYNYTAPVNLSTAISSKLRIRKVSNPTISMWQEVGEGR